jgi:hypothetical protein
MERLVRTVLRTIIGTVIYACIVYLAAAAPTAAGLMLTFPTLNGLAFYFSDKASAAPMAKTMLWMPVVNGILCALYLLLFLCFDRLVPPTVLACGLAVAVTAAWLVLVSRRRLLLGISSSDQFAFAAASTIVGAIFVAAGIYLMRSGEIVQHVPWSDRAPPFLQVMHLGSVKIVLFGLCLAAFLLATAYLPMRDSIRGILAGLPIVPFGGLVSVASDAGSSLESRLQTLQGMSISVWLGPAVAIWFIYGLSRHFSARRTLAVPALDNAARFATLVTAWLTCFLVIMSVSFVIGLF